MKNKFLDYSINKIKSKYPDYNEDRIEVITYGLEALYVLVSKTTVIFLVALLLGILKDVFLVFLFYGIIRTTAFGLHAEKSSHCYIMSITLFIGAAILCKFVDINFYIKIIISVFSFVTFILYAPADTYKRPLLNAKKRQIYKIVTLINSFIYIILIIILKDHFLSDYLVMGLLDASLMIHPLIYRMFQLPYNNYKKYEATYG